VTLAYFHSDGKEDNDSDMLNNLHSGYFNIGAASCKSRGLIQSGPVACPGILKNYRPISLISIIGKVMERCVYKHIYNFLLENRIISSNQSGFFYVINYKITIMFNRGYSSAAFIVSC
jgi:hypothetical protein